MNKYDKDNMFCAMPCWNMIDKWAKSSESELPIKDKKKLQLIAQTLMQLFRSVAKDMGKESYDALLEESKKYDFLIAPRDAKVGEQITGTFQDTINESVIKKVLEDTDYECMLCDRNSDFTNCSRYSLYSLVENVPKNCHECPFKRRLF